MTFALASKGRIAYFVDQRSVATATGVQNAGGAALSNLSVTLRDTAGGLTLTLAPSGNMLARSVANASGTTLATTALDYSGSGTVTYSDGTTSMVRDFIVIG
jgi:hypothetical protein